MVRDLFNQNVVKSEWLHPTEFPSMKGKEVVAIDLETCDTDLKKMGPGWPRKIGKVIGIAVSSGDFTAYYPIAHDGGGNMDSKVVLKYVKSMAQFFEREITGENAESHKYEVMPLFSPVFLVEAPNTKRAAWEDMQKVMKKLNL